MLNHEPNDCIFCAEDAAFVQQYNDTHTAWVCTDCMLWAVNNDNSGAAEIWSPAQYAAGVAELTGDHDAMLVLSSADDFDENGEPLDDNGHIDFSAKRCDTCASGLAGERFRMVVFAD